MAPDDVDKFLSDETQLESRRQELIKETLRQKEAAMKAFDEKLARLGHGEDHASKRSHHRRGAETKPGEPKKGEAKASETRKADAESPGPRRS